MESHISGLEARAALRRKFADQILKTQDNLFAKKW